MRSNPSHRSTKLPEFAHNAPSRAPGDALATAVEFFSASEYSGLKTYDRSAFSTPRGRVGIGSDSAAAGGEGSVRPSVMFFAART